jgi:hypothetical protein
MSDQENRNAAERDRRAFLVSAGKFAVAVPPVMTVLLSTTMSSTAIAQSGAPSGGETPKGNNGVGNGLDPQPPGNPPVNDGAGTAPGMPAARDRRR